MKYDDLRKIDSDILGSLESEDDIRNEIEQTDLFNDEILALTFSNYEEAATLLKKRFGNKQQQSSKHMDILLNLEPVTSSRNTNTLRHLYDKVETQVRCLRSLGVTPSSYGSVLASVLMSKIPPVPHC